MKTTTTTKSTKEKKYLKVSADAKSTRLSTVDIAAPVTETERTSNIEPPTTVAQWANLQ